MILLELGVLRWADVEMVLYFFTNSMILWLYLVVYNKRLYGRNRISWHCKFSEPPSIGGHQSKYLPGMVIEKAWSSTIYKPRIIDNNGGLSYDPVHCPRSARSGSNAGSQVVDACSGSERLDCSSCWDPRKIGQWLLKKIFGSGDESPICGICKKGNIV